MMNLFQMTDNVKIGLTLTGLGLFFLCLGCLLFFDGSLLTIGNILLLAGFPFIIGFQSTLDFFNPFLKGGRPGRGVGIFLFFFGVFLVVIVGWPVLGMLLETIGLFNMFFYFLKTFFSLLENIPVIGVVFRSAACKRLGNMLPREAPPKRASNV